MDCKTARMLCELRGNRDSELPLEDDAALDQHVASCPDCRSAVGVERQIDAHLARGMQAVAVPPGLKMRIRDRMATERGAWYRRRIFVGAAAAAILVAVGFLTWPSKPMLDQNELHKLAHNADLFRGNPKAAVESWLAAKGAGYELPEAFEPSLIAFYGMADVQGKQVPVVVYFNSERNVFAQVFVVRSDDFDLSKLQETDSSPSYRTKVKVMKSAGLAYVILYDGDSLDPFKKKVGSA